MNKVGVRKLELMFGKPKTTWCEEGRRLYEKVKNKDGSVSVCKKTFSKVKDGSTLPCPSAWIKLGHRKRAFSIEREICDKCDDCIGCYRRFANRFWRKRK